MKTKAKLQSPYVGPKPFEKQDKAFFYGRDREINDLLSLVVAHRAVLLYAQSGAGKTSLINAGLNAALEDEGFEVFPTARVRGLIPRGLMPEQILNIYVFNTLLSWSHITIENENVMQQVARLTLADFLQQAKRPLDRSGEPAPRVVIFDQFEELFSFYYERREERGGFFEQVAHALEEDSLLRVLFIIREDFLAQLDPYVSILPERLKTRYRLERLGQAAASLAIEKPAENTGRSFSSRVAEKLVRELTKTRVEGATGETVETLGEYVEPVQLQIVCDNLWQSLPPDVNVITEEHLQTFGDVDEALRNFYVRAIKIATNETGVGEGTLRKWFDSQLITPAGTRGTVFRGKKSTGAVANNTIDLLVNEHIIRAELRAGARWYELTHDRLIEPIRKSNEAWYRHQQAEEQQRQVAEERDRAEEQQQRADEQTRIASRLRRLTAALVVVLIIAAGAAIYALIQRSYALEQSRIGISRELVANANNLIKTDPELSLLLTRQAVLLTHKEDNNVLPAAENALHQALLASRIRLNLNGHTDAVRRVALSPDGTMVATASYDGTMKVWNTETGQEIFSKNTPPKNRGFLGVGFERLPLNLAEKYGIQKNLGVLVNKVLEGQAASKAGFKQDDIILKVNGKEVDFYRFVNIVAGFSPESRVDFELNRDGHRLNLTAILGTRPGKIEFTSVTFNPDGSLLAAGNATGNVIIVDVHSGQDLLTINGHAGWITNLTFSPDGKRLATSGYDKKAMIWDVATGARLLNIAGHTDYVNGVAFSPEGSRLVTAGEDKTVRFWDAASGKELRLSIKYPVEVFAVAYSPDGTRLAVAGRELTFRIYDTNSAEELQTFSGHTNSIMQIAFSADGTLIATASHDKTAKIWNLKTGQELFTFAGHSESVYDLAFSSDGTRLVTASSDKTAKIWDASRGKEVHTITAHNSQINDVDFSPDGRRLVTAASDNTAKVWDAATGKPLLTLVGHTANINDVICSPDGTKLATASNDKTARVWDAATGKTLLTLTGHSLWLDDIAFSRDGTRLATASGDKTVIIWEVASGKKLLNFKKHTGPVYSVAFSPDGRRVATAGRDRILKVWAAATGEEIQTFPEYSSWINGLSFSPDGKLLAIAHRDGTAKVLDATSGKVLVNLNGHTAGLLGITFSPSGKRLATVSLDKTAKVWDAESGAELLTLSGHSGSVTAVDFSPDERYLATTSDDNTVRVYMLEIGDLLATARTRVTRSLTLAECQKYLHRDTCPPEVAALDLYLTGKKSAQSGNLVDAVDRFRQALNLDPTLSFNSQSEANHLAAVAHAAQGRSLARAQNIDGAVLAFQKAWELGHKLEFEPEAHARQLAANYLLAKGVRMIKIGDIQKANAAYARAQRMDPYLAISGEHWNTLCWYGSLKAQAADVFDACEKAVALDPANGNFRDSRGVARALTGDFGGAIEDFEAFITYTGNEISKKKRQRWVEALRADQNPFSNKELNQLWQE